MCKLDLYSIISFSVAVAHPSFPTTTPAARFAKCIASSIFELQAKEKPIDASTVSPAPVTS